MWIGLVHNETLARLIAMHCMAVIGAQCNEGVDRPGRPGVDLNNHSCGGVSGSGCLQHGLLAVFLGPGRLQIGSVCLANMILDRARQRASVTPVTKTATPVASQLVCWLV
jgi:hypothetical protein